MARPRPAQKGRRRLTHADFLAAYRDGRIRVLVDREGAARFVARRMLLPFVLLPLLGISVALALTGEVIWGIAIFILVLIFRYAVKASSQGFVLSRALSDERFYGEAVASGLLRIEP